MSNAAASPWAYRLIASSTLLNRLSLSGTHAKLHVGRGTCRPSESFARVSKKKSRIAIALGNARLDGFGSPAPEGVGHAPDQQREKAGAALEGAVVDREGGHEDRRGDKQKTAERPGQGPVGPVGMRLA